MKYPTVSWVNGKIKLIDQTKLPAKLEFIYCRDVKTLWRAIKQLSVRGAPAIGVAAAFGVVLGAKAFIGKTNGQLIKHIEKTCAYIGSSRPTAVNLFYALERMKKVLYCYQNESIADIKSELEKEAILMHEEDRKTCRVMGQYGAKLIRPNSSLLTVCNAGALATVDYGTAQGVFYAAKEAQKKFKVYACETRPLLQGARLTTWELLQANIDTTLICDNMAATLMQQGQIHAVFTGADRIAANGDSANKIGTYMLAVLAKHHRIPFYIVAPRSTFDLKIASGSQIPIEERDPDEVRGFYGKKTAPDRVKVYNPAFDVTPAKLITAIVTEKGVVRGPNRKNIKKIFS